MSDTPYKFDLPQHHKSIIKVIGVGGGGSNAVNHMFNQGIKDVEFVVCNTDVQALKSSPVPTKLQIGVDLTEGLGAGANPEVGRNAALESKEDIRDFLSDGTKMVFITAGMGGGTGTGAAPVIAKIAKDLEILTVGIVTLPFKFEGKRKLQSAKDGIAELKQFCDTVLVIVNEKLFEMNDDDLTVSEAYAKADNVLTTGAKSIAEIITVTTHVNVDFEDVKTVMKNSGAAVMGSGVASGENRALNAVMSAINSPLLDNTDILGAKKILLSLSSGETKELTMKEMSLITNFIEEKAGNEVEVIHGQGIDSELGDQIRVTIIATGFDHNYEKSTVAPPVSAVAPPVEAVKKTIYDLEKDVKPERQEIPAPVEPQREMYSFEKPKEPSNNIIFKPSPSIEEFRNRNEYVAPLPTPEPVRAEQPAVFYFPTEQKTQAHYEEVRPEVSTKSLFPNQPQFDFGTEMEEKKELLRKQAQDRVMKLKKFNSMDINPDEYKEKFDVPAYKRRNVSLPEYPHSSENKISRFNINDDNEILGNNKFLHDNVD